MLFAIHAIDRPGTSTKRNELMEAVRSYVSRGREQGINVSLAGPLTADDGNNFIGSLFVIEAPNRAAVEKFVKESPLQTNGIWDKVQIHGFRRMMG